MSKAINTINSFDQCSQGLYYSCPWRDVVLASVLVLYKTEGLRCKPHCVKTTACRYSKMSTSLSSPSFSHLSISTALGVSEVRVILRLAARLQ